MCKCAHCIVIVIVLTKIANTCHVCSNTYYIHTIVHTPGTVPGYRMFSGIDIDMAFRKEKKFEKGIFLLPQ
jgi:hypothetical protein